MENFKILFFVLLFFVSVGIAVTPMVIDTPPFQTKECHTVVDKTSTDIVNFTLDNDDTVPIDSEIFNTTKVGDPYCIYSFTTLSIIMMVVGFLVAAIILVAVGGGEIVGDIIEGVL